MTHLLYLCAADKHMFTFTTLNVAVCRKSVE
jgi:hypothetical protein